MTERNLQKGGLVHRVPYTKSREKLQKLFQSVSVLFCVYITLLKKYKMVSVFTYAHVKWFYGQTERAYCLNYFITLDLKSHFIIFCE